MVVGCFASIGLILLATVQDFRSKSKQSQARLSFGR